MEVADIAQAIAQAGHLVEVMTIHWDKNWPIHFRFREITVNRFNRRLGGPWGMFRYLRDLHSYVNESQFDALIIYGLTDESWAALRNFVHTIPLGLRVDRQDWNDFVNRRFHFRQRRFLKHLAQIWVYDQETQQALVQSLVPPEIIEIVPPCIQLPADFERSASRKTTIRASLSDAHPILELEPHYPFALCASPLDDPGMDRLLQAWRLVVRQLPRARLWILGEGQGQHETWQKICDLQITHSVAMPGQFDQIEDLLVAADLYLHPSIANTPCHRLARAMACASCVLAVDTPFSRSSIYHLKNGILVSDPGPQPLAEAIVGAFGSVDLRNELGNAARDVGKQFCVENWVDAFLRLTAATDSSRGR
jgi:glycosyltransferase involved in cell wall biosynthesis